jgi:hypothetical protein
MDLATLLIGIGVVALMVVPLFLIEYSSKRKVTQKMKGLKKTAQTLGVDLTRIESWDDQLIGIDPLQRKLIVFSNIEDISSAKIYNLKEYQKCSLSLDRRGGKSRKDPSSVIERVNLVLHPIGLRSPDCKINFYDSAFNMSIHNEMEVAQRWEKIIGEVISQ